MTQNQIALRRAKEQERADQAKEKNDALIGAGTALLNGGIKLLTGSSVI